MVCYINQYIAVMECASCLSGLSTVVHAMPPFMSFLELLAPQAPESVGRLLGAGQRHAIVGREAQVPLARFDADACWQRVGTMSLEPEHAHGMLLIGAPGRAHPLGGESPLLARQGEE